MLRFSTALGSAWFLLLLPTGFAGATVLRVPSEYPTIQAAVDAANQPGDTVLVADGFYIGTGNHDIDLRGKAITVRSENGPANCIIDCQGSAMYPHRGFRCMSDETWQTIIDGFTIQNGRAPYESQCLYAGGAIVCGYSSPKIRHCIIRANSAPDY